MRKYILSNRADGDLTDIFVYSAQQFGEPQAESYFLGLCNCLSLLGENPKLGRDVAHLWPELKAHHHERHVVFYLIEAETIFVVRVLHESMDFTRHVQVDSQTDA